MMLTAAGRRMVITTRSSPGRSPAAVTSRESGPGSVSACCTWATSSGVMGASPSTTLSAGFWAFNADTSGSRRPPGTARPSATTSTVLPSTWVRAWSKSVSSRTCIPSWRRASASRSSTRARLPTSSTRGVAATTSPRRSGQVMIHDLGATRLGSGSPASRMLRRGQRWRASQLLDRGVAQQQRLQAGVTEVDRRLGMLARAGCGDNGAEPEGVMSDAVAGRQDRDGPVGLARARCSTVRDAAGTVRRAGHPPGLVGLRAAPVQQFRRDLVEEPRRRVVAGRSPGTAHDGPRQVQPLPGPSDADVGQPALFLELARLGERALVWKDAVLEAGEEHDGELQTLRRVQRHQRDDTTVVLALRYVVGVGDEAHLLEECGEHPGVLHRGRRRLELAGHRDQFTQVVGAGLVLWVVGRGELREISGAIEDGFQHGRRRGTVGGDGPQVVG